MGIKEIIAELSNPLPDNLIKSRPQGDGDVSFVEWFTVADMLDRICPDWQWFIRSIETVNGEIVVTGSLTIAGVTRDGVGSEAIDSKSYASKVKTAERDALKRAATWFGVARELYHKVGGFPSKESEQAQHRDQPLPPKNADGVCEKVPATVISKEDKSTWTALMVKVQGISLPVRYFFGGSKNPVTTNDIAEDIGMRGKPFPWSCRVDVKPKDPTVKDSKAPGYWAEIIKFYPAD